MNLVLLMKFIEIEMKYVLLGVVTSPNTKM